MRCDGKVDVEMILTDELDSHGVLAVQLPAPPDSISQCSPCRFQMIRKVSQLFLPVGSEREKKKEGERLVIGHRSLEMISIWQKIVEERAASGQWRAFFIIMLHSHQSRCQLYQSRATADGPDRT